MLDENIQCKKIKANNARPRKFDIDACIIFDGYSKSLISVRDWKLGVFSRKSDRHHFWQEDEFKQRVTVFSV